MLVEMYIIRFLSYDNKIIETLTWGKCPTKEDIEELLLERKEKAFTCEVTTGFRLHSDTKYL